MQTIRALRQERGWTQFELALRVGVQPQAVYLWESGRRTPQVAQMRKLGEVFGLCSDEIELDPGPMAPRAPRVQHRPRADRHAGEHPPGRDLEGRATPRRGVTRAADRTEA
ncbi:MAG: helix-turn-helix domain-containing protein [Chloroflexota bacterium]|nr:helix-turn-helix domain-containing protein [Chloroflexota bacterium]